MEYSAKVNTDGSQSIPLPVGFWEEKADSLSDEQKEKVVIIESEIAKNFEDCGNIQFYLTFKKQKRRIPTLREIDQAIIIASAIIIALGVLMAMMLIG